MLFNIHTHIINKSYIPEEFLPLKLTRILASTKVSRVFARALNWLHPFSGDDLLDRYARFIRVAGKRSQLEIFQSLVKIYHSFCAKHNIPLSEVRIAVLTLDLEYMKAGKAKSSYEKQLEDIHKIKENPEYKDTILPFLCIDPRRENREALIEKYIDTGIFNGVKIYPALGFYPFTYEFETIFPKLEEKGIPIVAHCSKGGIYSREGSQKDCQRFSHPANWKPVLKRYPNLKICLAHMGGLQDVENYVSGKGNIKDNWFYIILQMIEEFPNLYTDISYSMYNKKYWNALKLVLNNPNIKGQILFGSDWYVLLSDGKEEDFLALKEYLSDEEFKLITDKNPNNFFNKKIVF